MSQQANSLYNYVELTIKDANQGIDGISALLLSGEPGTGKTFVAEMIQKRWKGSEKIFIQLYEGIEKEKLLMDVHLPNLVKGMQLDYNKLALMFQSIKDAILQRQDGPSIKEQMVTIFNEYITDLEKTDEKNAAKKLSKTFSEFLAEKSIELKNDAVGLAGTNLQVQAPDSNVILDGVLYKAVKDSLTKRVVLILDEIDKGDESIDILLLDLIQNARISDPIFGNITGNSKNLIIVMTSNEDRELNKALYRRVRKVRMNHPTVNDQYLIIKSKIGKEISDKLGEELIRKVIDISEEYRKKNPVIKSNVYVLYRIVLDINSLHKKETAIDDIVFSIKSWFTDKDTDKKIIEDIKTKEKVIELLKLIK